MGGVFWKWKRGVWMVRFFRVFLQIFLADIGLILLVFWHYIVCLCYFLFFLVGIVFYMPV
ncbi:hypothetical protein BC829DRAFT_387281, partial [Chytridium lagenaria]